MKKIGLVLVCAMVALLAGCSNAAQEAQSDSASAAESSDAAEVSSQEIAASTVSQPEDGEFLDTVGVKLYVPSDFKQTRLMLYYSFKKDFENDTMYFAFDNNAWYEADTESSESADVPAIENDWLKNVIAETIGAPVTLMTFSVDEEENQTLIDMPVTRQKGSIAVTSSDGDKTLDYVAYYTEYSNQWYQNAPAAIVVFSECKDEVNVSLMDETAVEIFTKTDWLG